MAPDRRPTLRFDWADARGTLTTLAAEYAWTAASGAGRFVGEAPAREAQVELAVPLVLGLPAKGTSLDLWIPAMRQSPGWHLVLLYQAGASALALYEDDTLRQAKVFKRYVVRGRGRAQPLHLKTKGKSRYGSRLRLQQAKALRDDIVGWLRAQAGGTPPWAQLFVAAPVRLWPDLYTGNALPPFDQRDPRIVRVPLDVRTPCEAERERVRAWLGQGVLRPIS